MKLKDEVGMEGSEYINKICRVNHIHYIHPTLAFLDYHVPVDGDTLVLSLT